MNNKIIVVLNIFLLKGLFLLGVAFFFATQLHGQTLLEGYVFEANTRGYLNQVKVTVFELPDNIVRGEVETSMDGHFVFNLPSGNYRVLAYKDIFFEKYDTLNLGKEKVFHKMELRRRPGYLFNPTVTEVRESPDQNISEKTTWKSFQQIIESEELERASKYKAPRSKRLGEANNSIPLPVLKPASDDFTERGELAAPAPTPRQLSDPKTARPVLANGGDSEVRILQLPPTFKGCAVELARSETELPANHPSFRGQKEVFRLLESDGKFTYLIANLGPKDAATAFFKKKIKPVNNTAKLVIYTDGGKEYLSE